MNTEREPLLRNNGHFTMAGRNNGISQQSLVSNGGGTNCQDDKAKKLPQYTASLAATLGALAAGMVIGWTSPAGTNGVNLATTYKINITEDEFSWIGSLAALGAGVMCIPIGLLCDLIGRKFSMLAMVIPFTIGWALLIFSTSIAMFYVGRFMTGVSLGAFCVAAPMYIAEIAESDVRGRLGSYFQLLLTIGILLTYTIGNFWNMKIVSIVSGVVPLIFFVVFSFMPESPTYYLQKEKYEAAKLSLQKFRGPQYNVEPELSAQTEAIEETKRNRISFLTALKSKATVKALVIGYGLMFFQQLSGVNAVIFYASNIFNKAGSSLPPNINAIIVGAIQVVATLISTMVVDNIGRRVLLMASGTAMCLTTFILGVYFYLSEINVDISSIQWLPLVSVCIFIILFSFGYGPIPWMMMGELFAPEVKGVAASSACLFNWIMAFIVTKFYTSVSLTINASGTFWIFSVICAIGIGFVYILVPETKGKTLEQIQREFSEN